MGSTSEFPPPRMGLTPKPSPVTEQNAPPEAGPGEGAWSAGLEAWVSCPPAHTCCIQDPL